ncbi:MAG: hypothetical protein WCR52_12250, partial [Bacteroidota bacterium]
GFVSEAQNADAVQYIWNAWIFQHNLHNGIGVFHTDQVLAPSGANLLMHTYTPAISIFCLPFQNRYLGMNLFLLLNFLFSAFGAYLLAKKLLQNQVAAILTGLTFGFSAFKLLHFPQHYHLLLSAPIPFYLYCFLQAFTFSNGKFLPKITSKNYAALTLLFGGLATLSDYYSAFYLLYFSILWATYHAYAPRWFAMSGKKKWGIVVLVLVAGHLLIQTLRNHHIDDKGGIYWGGDLLSFFMPNPNTWLWSAEWFTRLLPHVKKGVGNLELDMFQGYAVLALGFFLLLKVLRRHLDAAIKPWAFILLVFIMICLPALIVNGVKIIYLPTALLHYIPFFNNIRCPTRIQVMIALLLPLCGSWALLTIPNATFRQAILWFVIAVTAFELKPKPYPILSTADVPPIIQTLKSSNATMLLPIPFGIRDGMREIGKIELNDLYYQTIHEKAMLGGYISRIPASTFEQYLSDPVCKQLLAFSADPNKKSTDPDQAAIDTFFQTFHPDAILIEPSYRRTNAEMYIETLLKNRTYESIELDKWRLITLH